MKRTKVRDLMTTDVVTLDKQQAIPLAQELMRMLHIRHLPVVNGDSPKVVGLVTHRSLLGAQVEVLAKLADDQDAEEELSIPVAQVMTTKVETVTPETTAAEALRIMLDVQRGCLPVIEDNKLVGILTSRDFLKFQRTQLDRAAGDPERLAKSAAQEAVAELWSKLGPRVGRPSWAVRLVWPLSLLCAVLAVALIVREATRPTVMDEAVDSTAAGVGMSEAGTSDVADAGPGRERAVGGKRGKATNSRVKDDAHVRSARASRPSALETPPAYGPWEPGSGVAHAGADAETDAGPPSEGQLLAPPELQKKKEKPRIRWVPEPIRQPVSPLTH